MKYIQFDQSEIQSTLEYWTDERIANAIPTPLQQISMPEIRQQKDDAFSKVEEEMFFCGFFCFPKKSKSEPLSIKRVNLNNETYSKAGKLYYIRNGKNRSCTAQFVGAPDILMTTAHSLKDSGGKWATKLLFVRADQKGVGFQKVKAAVSAASISEEWDKISIYGNRVKWDYGFAKTTRPSNVGYLDLSLQLPVEIKSIGYPGNYGNNGKYMYEAYGLTTLCKDGIVRMDDNFMEEGSSGGAWFPLIADHQVVGINSGGNMGTMFGPVFDRHTLTLFNRFYNQTYSLIPHRNKPFF